MTQRDGRLRAGPPPLSEQDKALYNKLDEETIRFLRARYNRITRWVIADLLQRSASRSPGKAALIFGDTVLTYSELEEATNRVAHALLDLGLERFDRVAVLAHNTLHHVLAWLGTAKAGGVYLAVNYLLRGKDIAYCVNHSESTIFIVEDALHDLVADVRKEMPAVRHFIREAGRMPRKTGSTLIPGMQPNLQQPPGLTCTSKIRCR